METVVSIIILSIKELVYLFGIIIIIGFLLGWLETIAAQWAYKAFGKTGILLTSCIGTPIHETGHALMCLLFGHKIIAIKFFDLNPQNETLGYVQHSFDQHNLYQNMGNFFISLGPIASGSATILFLMYWLEPHTFSVLQQMAASAPAAHTTMDLLTWSRHSMSIVYSGLWNSPSFGSLKYCGFLVLAICISSHIALSKIDLKNAMAGLNVIFFGVLICNFVAAFFGVDTLYYVLEVASYNIYLLSILSVSLLFSIFTALVMGVCAVFFRTYTT